MYGTNVYLNTICRTAHPISDMYTPFTGNDCTNWLHRRHNMHIMVGSFSAVDSSTSRMHVNNNCVSLSLSLDCSWSVNTLIRCGVSLLINWTNGDAMAPRSYCRQICCNIERQSDPSPITSDKYLNSLSSTSK